MRTTFASLPAAIVLVLSMCTFASSEENGTFEGVFCSGVGDVQYLKMLDDCWRTLDGSGGGQNLLQLYSKEFDSLRESPDWNGVWTQNSYGMYTWTPLLPDELFGMLDRAYNHWFAWQGDGRRKGNNGWVAPPGALMDAVVAGGVYYKQGDGNVKIHDFYVEGTCSGVLCKAEMLLASRNPRDIKEYLPKLELGLDYVETRRDPQNDLFKVGPAANLLAPNYAGTKKDDGSFAPGYLTGISVSYAAALDRVIELEKLAERPLKAAEYRARKQRTVDALLKNMTTPEGYLIKYIDLNGIRHGVFAADTFGYFCSSPNHDAIAHRIVDDVTARKIYAKIESIPELRPNDFICANYPGLDDMYVNWGTREAPGIWVAGHWVNGGAWLTCESRMIMAYYRLGEYDDIRRSVTKVLDALRNNIGCGVRTDWGRSRYKMQAGHLDLDTFGVPGGGLRGLFEYIYGADSLTLHPHVPRAISSYRQKKPVRFGDKRIYLNVENKGNRIVNVTVNGNVWKNFDETSVVLTYDSLPAVANVEIRTD
jgi:hypothetical protein